MHKVLVASCLAAVAYAEAEPSYLGYGYGYGYGLGGVSTGVGLHPTGSVYESRSAQGLGKRSAEPGYIGYGLAPYGYAIGRVSTGVGLHPTGSVYESRSAQGLGKRSADAEPGYYTQNYWPSIVTPYGHSTCYGCRGKRSAEPGYIGLGYGYGYGYGLGGISTGVGLHSTGSVYESRSAQGLGKRSADAEPGYLGLGYGYGYGLAPYAYAIGGVSTGVGLHPTGSVYESRSAQGLGKRSADDEPGYLGLGYGYGYGLGGISTGLGLHPTGSVYESRSAQGLSGRYLY